MYFTLSVISAVALIFYCTCIILRYGIVTNNLYKDQGRNGACGFKVGSTNAATCQLIVDL